MASPQPEPEVDVDDELKRMQAELAAMEAEKTEVSWRAKGGCWLSDRACSDVSWRRQMRSQRVRGMQR